MNEFATAIPILVTGTACSICAVTDLRHFRVPNVVTLPLIATGLAYQLSTAGWHGLFVGLGGAAFGLAVLVVPYLLGAMGAGDVKLLMGIGSWLGRPMTFDVLLAAVLFGGLYSLCLVVATGRLRRTLADVGTVLARGLQPVDVPVREAVNCPERRGRLVPFAAMLALGLLTTIVRF
jgi:prepilin peptidase CpaA